jgi:hypothetical protein
LRVRNPYCLLLIRSRSGEVICKEDDRTMQIAACAGTEN